MRDTGELSYLIGDDEIHYVRLLYPEAYVFVHSRHIFFDIKYHRDEDYAADAGGQIQIIVADNDNYESYAETKCLDMKGSVKFDIGVFLRALLEGTMQEDSVFDYSQNSKAVANHSVTVTLKYYNTQFFTTTLEVVNGADEYQDDWWKEERRLHWWYNYPFTFDFRNLDEASYSKNGNTVTQKPLPQITPDSKNYTRIRINAKALTSSAKTVLLYTSQGMRFSDGAFGSNNSNRVLLVGHGCEVSEKHIYLRWLNRHGELCYWLFHRYSVQQVVKDNEHVRANINDIWPESGVIDNASIRNKTVTKEVKAYTDELDGSDYELVRQVFIAPFVDVFERTILGQNHVWQRVHVKAETQTEALRHADEYTKNRQIVITLLMPEEGCIEV